MRTTRTIAVVAGVTLVGLVLAGCGDDDGTATSTAAAPTTVASATSAAPTTAAASLEAYVAAMTPICEEMDAAVNQALAPVFASEGEPDPLVAQQALTSAGDALDTFVAASAAVPAPPQAADVLASYGGIQQLVVEAAATPEAALAFLMGDDPTTEVGRSFDALGLPACGTGGTFATITEVPLSAAPEDAIAFEAFDFGWKGLPATLPAGEVTLTMTNGAEQDHELLLLPLAPDADPAEVLTLLRSGTDEEMDEAFATLAAGPPGGMFAGPGGAVAGVTELQPGSYAVVCFLPDEATGKGHRELGMASVVQVS